MTNESSMVLEIWDLVRDHLPPGRRHDVAVGILRAAVEYGFEVRDLADLVDEDAILGRALRDAFDDEDVEDDIDYESLDDDEE